MHTAEEQARDGGDIFEEITVANVADLRTVRRQCTIQLVIRHPDVPAGISLGTFYLESTPGQLLKAIEESFPEFLRNLETGVSEARRATFPPDHFRGALFGAPVGGEGVVRNSEVER